MELMNKLKNFGCVKVKRHYTGQYQTIYTSESKEREGERKIYVDVA